MEIGAWLVCGVLCDLLYESAASDILLTEDYLAQEQEFLAVDRSSGERIMSTSNGRAQIRVEGVMTKNPSFFARFFGGGNTTYGEIIAATAMAEEDPAVKGIDYVITSPGGNMTGLFQAMDAIRNAKKPTRAIGVDTVASAAYGIASQADEVVSSSDTDIWGSVGVVVDALINDQRVTITNTDSPKKRPDLSTEEGKSVVRGFLDELYGKFSAAIATGRDIATETVNAKFGKGNVMLTEKAIDAGMVDGIVGEQQADGASASADEPPAASEEDLKESKMDLEKLKAEHPALFQEVLKLGAEEERKRVNAHLNMGEAAGDGGMQIAVEAIKGGDDLDIEMQSKYLAARMDNADSTNANKDEEELGEGANNANGGEPEAKDDVTKAHEEILGTEGEHDFVVDAEGGEA